MRHTIFAAILTAILAILAAAGVFAVRELTPTVYTVTGKTHTPPWVYRAGDGIKVYQRESWSVDVDNGEYTLYIECTQRAYDRLSVGDVVELITVPNKYGVQGQRLSIDY